MHVQSQCNQSESIIQYLCTWKDLHHLIKIVKSTCHNTGRGGYPFLTATSRGGGTQILQGLQGGWGGYTFFPKNDHPPYQEILNSPLPCWLFRLLITFFCGMALVHPKCIISNEVNATDKCFSFSKGVLIGHKSALASERGTCMTWILWSSSLNIFFPAIWLATAVPFFLFPL